MLYYFYGPDTYGARQEISRLAKDNKAIIRWLEADSLAQRPIGDWFQQSGGLWGKEVIAIRDPRALSSEIQEDIIAQAKGDVAGEVVIWERGKIDARVKLHQALTRYGRKFPHLNEAQLVQWLGQQAREHGGEIEPAAARVMVAYLGFDRWRLLSELERLLLVDGAITTGVVRKEISQPLQAEMFSTLDHIVRGNGAQALRGVEILLEQGNNEFYILSMLGYQYRTLLLIRHALASQSGAEGIARVTKLHPFAVQKSLFAAKALTEEAIETSLTRIAATDFAIKRGKADARTALSMLVQGLAQRA